MPYQALLDGLMRDVSGARVALLLDETGELVLFAGRSDETQHLLGAYQGIALAALRRICARYQGGEVEYVVCRYQRGHVILRPLREGYYLVLSLLAEADVPLGLHHSATVQAGLNEAL
jgi:predicted regulator of Ras-like GTPase activity (Roadblock/LC7/MglB family)